MANFSTTVQALSVRLEFQEVPGPMTIDLLWSHFVGTDALVMLGGLISGEAQPVFSQAQEQVEVGIDWPTLSEENKVGPYWYKSISYNSPLVLEIAGMSVATVTAIAHILRTVNAARRDMAETKDAVSRSRLRSAAYDAMRQMVVENNKRVDLENSRVGPLVDRILESGANAVFAIERADVASAEQIAPPANAIEDVPRSTPPGPVAG